MRLAAAAGGFCTEGKGEDGDQGTNLLHWFTEGIAVRFEGFLHVRFAGDFDSHFQAFVVEDFVGFFHFILAVVYHFCLGLRHDERWNVVDSSGALEAVGRRRWARSADEIVR